MKKIPLTIIALFAFVQFAFAQHEGHKMPGMKQTQPKSAPKAQKKKVTDTASQKHHHADTTAGRTTMHTGDTGSHSEHTGLHMEVMSSAFSKNLPMNRNGSATSWLPDNSPIYGVMKHAKKWMFMFHGNLFIRYNNQDFTRKGSRGGEKWDAPNYLMAMGQRKVGRNGLFHFSSMFSLDALIAGGSGYPLLFQSGESWNGAPLVDRQHPHDLFSELSVGYTHAFSKNSDAYIYIGYPGEPTIGSVVFMHRPSAMFNPNAPISHHWNDGTHITFGSATVGYRFRKLKIEASSFTGREPDENRYNFDKMRFDSWSGRLSYNPSAHWAFQVSNGYIKSPEALHPGENITRTTASAIYSTTFDRRRLFNATALWGQNKIQGQEGSNAALLEANFKSARLAVYTRYEWAQKSGEELSLDGNIYNSHGLYAVNALTLGAGYDLFNIGPLTLAAGAQISVYHADQALNSLYGKNPLAGQVYLHIYPKLMN